MPTRRKTTLIKRFDLGIAGIEKKTVNNKPSAEDIRTALNNAFNPPGKNQWDKWVTDLYPVKYPNGQVIVSERVDGGAEKYYLYEYIYEDGFANIISDPAEVDNKYILKNDRDIEKRSTIVTQESYNAPSDMDIFGINIKKGEELHLATGVVLAPDEVDGQGDIYDEDEIRKAAHEFMTNYTGQGNGFMHKSFGESKLRIVDTIALSKEIVKLIKEDKIKAGSWLMSTLILDKKIWDDVKKGKITGYSIRGKANARQES